MQFRTKSAEHGRTRSDKPRALAETRDASCFRDDDDNLSPMYVYMYEQAATTVESKLPPTAAAQRRRESLRLEMLFAVERAREPPVSSQQSARTLERMRDGR